MFPHCTIISINCLVHSKSFDIYYSGTTQPLLPLKALTIIETTFIID